MKPPWTRWPEQCCTSPRRKDCSQPRDASPSLRGSTSSSRRSSWEASVPAPQRGNTSALIHTLPPVQARSPGAGQTWSCVKGGSHHRSSGTSPPRPPGSIRLWRKTLSFSLLCWLVFLSLLKNMLHSCPKIKFLGPPLPTPNPHHQLPRATVCGFAVTTGHTMFWVKTLQLCDSVTFLPAILHCLAKL